MLGALGFQGAEQGLHGALAHARLAVEADDVAARGPPGRAGSGQPCRPCPRRGALRRPPAQAGTPPQPSTAMASAMGSSSTLMPRRRRLSAIHLESSLKRAPRRTVRPSARAATIKARLVMLLEPGTLTGAVEGRGLGLDLVGQRSRRGPAAARPSAGRRRLCAGGRAPHGAGLLQVLGAGRPVAARRPLSRRIMLARLDSEDGFPQAGVGGGHCGCCPRSPLPATGEAAARALPAGQLGAEGEGHGMGQVRDLADQAVVGRRG